MSNKSSGVYIIDNNYNVISCNDTILELYPGLEAGKKCYKCLMNLDGPCPPCPVANHIYGPQTYLDPIRGIYETVDAVNMTLPDGSTGHALVLSTVGESETISARLPQSRAELTRLLEHEYFDSLTEGLSRKGFIRETERIFFRDDPRKYAMIMFDLRNFKAMNETFGISCGDQILLYIFQTLKNSWLSPSVSARLESDWFIFLVKKNVLDLNRLDELLNLQWTNDLQSVHLHLRCGIYPIDSCEESVTKMVDRTILAKEASDQRETGNFAIFDLEMRKRYVNRAGILSSFQDSMLRDELKVYFQPVVRCSDGRISSAEALVRWKHPEMGVISPGDFIPELEKNGLVSQLDHFVLGKVYQFQKFMQEKGLKYVPVSINLSRQDFYNDQMINDIFSYRIQSRLPGGMINYEVTETSVAVLKENCAYYLSQFRKNGAKVLMDDFGAGYSSLGMIGNFPIDIIKIDKTFIDRIESQPVTRSIITAIIDVCHKAGLSVVAEGVENVSQADFLRKTGCDYIQGYYFYRPMSEENFRDLLISSQETLDQMNSPNSQVSETAGQTVDIYNLLDLVDHSGQFIQVCHPEDYSMVFANEMTRNISGHTDEPYQGRKCYEYMLGLNAPCGHCPMKQMGDETEKEIETDDGEHIFRLKARFTTWNGRRVFMEYGRNITETKAAQTRYTGQIRSILEALPDGQGVFHMDLTADSWISSGGHAQNARNIQNMESVDSLIRRIGSFVPTPEGQEEFFRIFCRDAQLKAYQNKQHQIVHETESYYDDRSIRWSRITTHLIDNPSNGHIESILYGVDISREAKHIQELEIERLHGKQEKELLQKQVRQAMEMYSKADRDRRYDYLTGLYSRLSLNEFLENSEKKPAQKITAAIMLDLDNFKDINDRYGHAAGDGCLRALGSLLLNFGVSRKIDFYRYGGDEFVGLVRDIGTDLSKLSSDLLSEIRKVCVKYGNVEIPLTACIGITSDGKDCQAMINNADKAMYLAKHHGKNQGCTV